jgi:hypothetical protein
LYDIDFSFRAHLAGYRVGVTLELPVVHRSTGTFDAEWEAAAQVFVKKFGGKLSPAPRRKFQMAAIVAQDRGETEQFWMEMLATLPERS